MKGHRFCVRIALATTVLASANFVRGNPKGGTVSQGSATFNTSGSQFTVNTSDRAFINWQSFNIGVGETTTFVQPSSSSLVWNQINDPNPSQILGTLNANGYVVLQNSAGFYVGGQASITTHGLMLTTAPIPNLDLSSSDPWQFSTPPPSASIINYGQINVGQGGSAFIIANNIQNQGTISAPGGTIGLYAGKDVLVSSRPDGRGLSATVTLPSGSVDNEGKLIADGGTIALHAQVVNQGGMVQANSVANINGSIELVASDEADNSGKVVADAGSILMQAQVVNQNGVLQANSVGSSKGAITLTAMDVQNDGVDAAVTLGANSLISARSDGSSGSSGGTVTIASDKNFSDQNTAAINVSGAAQAGLPFTFTVNGNSALGSSSGATDGGQLSVSAANIGSIQSVVDGHAVTGPTGGKYTIDAANLTLNNAFINSIAPTFDSGQYKISLQAANNITILNALTLADPGASAVLNLTAGNDIILNANTSIQAGKNWNLSLTAGPLDLAAKPATSRTDGIYLDGNSFIQTLNGNIDLRSANEVLVNNGAIRTTGGGNIHVTTKFGNVNSGINPNGFVFNSINKVPPLYTISPNLGGISTVAGGNVTIDAGGDVISYLPTQSDINAGRIDAGTGAFGSNPGNVTITAGGKVTGHYVVANGIGSITANGGDIGVPAKQTGGFALSLIKGSWNVAATHGSIYLKEVRNPNGMFNSQGPTSSPGWHFFDYDPEDSVSLHAANSVEITGGLVRLTGASVPIIFPSSLSVLADTGSFTLDDNVILFPSPDQNLSITTLAGNFEGNNHFLEMSDSASHQWTGSTSFSSNDHSTTPPEINNPNPVEISIAGDMDNVTLYTTKETHIFVGGDMNNSGFLGENLHSSDKTTIDVLGRIFNTPVLNFVSLPGPITGSDATDPTRWDAFFEVAVDPSVVNLDITGLTPAAVKQALLNSYLLFPNLNSRFGLGANPGFIYDPTTDRLGFNGTMATLSAAQIAALKGGVFTLLVIDKNGDPLTDPNDPTHSHLWTTPLDTPYTFLSPTDPSHSGKDSASLIASLYSESLAAPTKASPGYQIGGPGEFNITAGSIELGNTPGIISWGLGNGTELQGLNYSVLAGVTPAESGAKINVITTGDLTMQTSRIASMFGGDVNITSTDGSINVGAQNFFITSVSPLAYGIYTSDHSDVTVLAHDDININGSRIAAYDGGDVTIESFYGNVNAGSGGNTYVNVPIVRAGKTQVNDQIYGSGIVALSLPPSLQSAGATKPGDITVTTPRGDIIAGQAGILQLALDGNIAGGPKVTLTAGTAAVKDDQGNIITPAITGNIDLGQSGLIGGEVNVTAQGDIKGLIVSRQGSTVNAAQNFSGTILSAGNANVSAGGTVAGVIVGIGGASVSGTITADVLGQNVSVNGGASQSTLGTTATATAASQSAANEATSETEKQVASDDSQDDEKKKKGKAPVLARRTGRVTVLMPKAI